MSARRALLVLNPAAGRGRARDLGPRLLAAGRRLGWEFALRTTRQAGDEVGLGRAARHEGWPVVVAVGGDGTVHGVANGLLHEGSSEVVLGHVPVGSGNDFARTLGLRPGNPERNLGATLAGVERRLDVGMALGEYFVNGLGVGFGAEVARQTLELRWLKGFVLYLAAALRTFAVFQARRLDVESVEHCETGQLMMLEVSIGKTAGGGFRITPDAVPDDGLFDVCLIRKVGLLTFVRHLPRVVRGTHTKLDPVRLFRTARLRVSGWTETPALHLDGELRALCERSLEIVILPRHLRVLCAA